jgi:hypothetical protein
MLERGLAMGDRERGAAMRMLAVFAFIAYLVVGLPADGAADSTKVLHSAPLGSGDTFSVTNFRASVVNLDSTPVVVTVSFCDLAGNCDINQNSDCVQVTVSAQQGCSATWDETNGGFRYAKIEIASPAKKIVAIGQLSARIGVQGSIVLATVPAR